MFDPDFANPDFANPDLADILVDMDFDFDDMPNTQVSLQLFFIILDLSDLSMATS